MARKSYINRQRKLANRLYADLASGPAPQAARTPIPDLLARAVALVEAHPEATYWAGHSHDGIAGTRCHLGRYYRPSIIPSGNVDLVVLYNPGVDGPAFPVATRVGNHYVAMTDITGFIAWMRTQGVTV